MKNTHAFSLLEVTLALGIFAFASVGLFGLLPAGLETFNSAIDQSVEVQIFQQMANQAQLSDFEQLAELAAEPFYFDNEGLPVVDAAKANYIASITVTSEIFQNTNDNRASVQKIAIRISRIGQQNNPNIGSATYTTHVANLGR